MPRRFGFDLTEIFDFIVEKNPDESVQALFGRWLRWVTDGEIDRYCASLLTGETRDEQDGEGGNVVETARKTLTEWRDRYAPIPEPSEG